MFFLVRVQGTVCFNMISLDYINLHAYQQYTKPTAFLGLLKEELSALWDFAI